MLQLARDIGFLMNPGDGAVTALDFHVPVAGGPPSHLLNGSSDGTLSVWQVRCRRSIIQAVHQLPKMSSPQYLAGFATHTRM